jgi:hypothetical protein
MKTVFSRLVPAALGSLALFQFSALAQSNGQSIFRYDTFGDEQLWTDVLQMQHVIENVSPATALSVGLKVDSDALPAAVLSALQAGQVNLNDPAYLSWGPGKYDARFHAFDGKKFIPLNSPTLPTVIPPAFGLQGVGFETFTGDGPISYWNNYVGVTQMGGHGDFSDPRIGLRIIQRPDLVTPKLPALLAYQLSLTTPPPPAGSFDPVAAARGETLFNGTARCASCHIPPTYTDVLAGPNPTVPLLHAASETGTEPVYATRSATKAYRTTPLRALWQHPPYFHDGSANDLPAVVNRYNTTLSLGLTETQKSDLVEFLKTL